jgi:hypothetical protein
MIPPEGAEVALRTAPDTPALSASLRKSTQILSASACSAAVSAMLRSVWYFNMSAGPDFGKVIRLTPRTFTLSPDARV